MHIYNHYTYKTVAAWLSGYDADLRLALSPTYA